MHIKPEYILASGVVIFILYRLSVVQREGYQNVKQVPKGLQDSTPAPPRKDPVVEVPDATNEEEADNRTIEIVVANYEERVDWLEEIPEQFYTKLTIYNKGSAKNYKFPKMTSVNLPNIGHCDHTYLYHVVNNYDTLADVTIFLPGSVWTQPTKKENADKMISFINIHKRPTLVCGDNPASHKNFSIDKWEVSSPENSRFSSQHKLTPASIRPFGAWFAAHFPGEKHECVSFFGIVSASKEGIRKRPKEFYQGLLNEVSMPSPEAGHYTERSWANTFSIKKSDYIVSSKLGSFFGI
jgi:hypothetical protein